MLLRSPEVSAETLLLLHSCREDRRYPQLSVQVAFSHEVAGCPRNCLCPVYGFVEILKNRGACVGDVACGEVSLSANNVPNAMRQSRLNSGNCSKPYVLRVKGRLVVAASK